MFDELKLIVPPAAGKTAYSQERSLCLTRKKYFPENKRHAASAAGATAKRSFWKNSIR